MDTLINLNIFITGMVIFFARICDVSLGTMRTIFIIQGKSVVAFFLGLIEIIIWLMVVSTVVLHIRDTPALILFYAFGFATGNAVGIIMERKLAFGFTILRVITKNAGKTIADRVRKSGQAVTSFVGEGMHGPVTELYIVCRRRDIKWLLFLVKEEDPEAFYITEQAKGLSKALRPIHQPVTGWLGFLKKK